MSGEGGEWRGWEVGKGVNGEGEGGRWGRGEWRRWEVERGVSGEGGEWRGG